MVKIGGMKYTMNKEQLGKLAMIQGAVEGRYTVMEAARRLNLSARRIKQLKKAFKENGAAAFIHGNSGRHPVNYTDEKIREKIISLKKSENYKDTNFTHFQELLEEYENIKISYSSLSRILKNNGITSKRCHRIEGKKFKRRNRRSAPGQMLQADGSSFDWFGTGVRCTLHAFIDDATGIITGLYFCQNECLMGYLEVLRQTLTNYGIPLEFYADKAGIFFVNTKKAANWTMEELLAGKTLDKTQFGRIVDEQLGVTMISAHTPQAKGRVERLWGTLQDRLPIWLRQKGITDMEKANQRLHKYIAEFNNRFAVKPALQESAFVPLEPSFDLNKLLAVRFDRTTDNCGCFSFHNFLFQVDSKIPLAKKKIQFLFSQKLGFQAQYGKEYFPVSFLGMNKNKKYSYIPDVTKLLIQKIYLDDGRLLQAA